VETEGVKKKAILLARISYPSEQQDRHAECARCQRKCEKCRLGCIEKRKTEYIKFVPQKLG
jgi:hypothetical protein